MLPDSLKKFLENNIELIDSNSFDELYKKAEHDLYFSQSCGTLTRALMKAGINPVPHITEIPYCFLYGDSEITRFEIPNNIKFISMEAFANCTALEQVTFGKNVSVVYYGAFEGCSNLKEVHMNDGLLEIGQYAFRGTSIEKLALPATLRNIDIQAFPDLVTLEVIPGTYAHEWARTNGYKVELVY